MSEISVKRFDGFNRLIAINKNGGYFYRSDGSNLQTEDNAIKLSVKASFFTATLKNNVGYFLLCSFASYVVCLLPMVQVNIHNYLTTKDTIENKRIFAKAKKLVREICLNLIV